MWIKLSALVGSDLHQEYVWSQGIDDKQAITAWMAEADIHGDPDLVDAVAVDKLPEHVFDEFRDKARYRLEKGIKLIAEANALADRLGIYFQVH